MWYTILRVTKKVTFIKSKKINISSLYKGIKIKNKIDILIF